MSDVPSSVDLSVVVPLRDGAATIESQLAALRAQTWTGAWEVLVVDNGSTDDGPARAGRVAAEDPRVRVVDAGAARGPGGTRNAGVEAARGGWIAFCDADDVVGDGWLSAVAEGLQHHPAVTGPQEQDRLNEPWVAGVYGREVERSLQTFDGIFPYGPGANLGVRRDRFEEVGGFDPALAVGEDIDLCLRLWQVGSPVTFVPDAIVHYRNRTTIRALFSQSIRYGAAGPMIVGRLAELGVRPPHRWAGLRTWVWVLRHLPGLARKPSRARWVVVVGRGLGRALGSVRHRTVYL